MRDSMPAIADLMAICQIPKSKRYLSLYLHKTCTLNQHCTPISSIYNFAFERQGFHCRSHHFLWKVKLFKIFKLQIILF
jgi:hypothetical protein